MKDINIIMRAVDESLFSGAKVAHGLSHPVIRRQGGEYLLAVFAYFVTREDARNGTLARPAKWALVDLKTEEVVEVNNCDEKDFSSAKEGSYNMTAYSDGKPTREKVKEVYKLLDDFRTSYVEAKKNVDSLAEAYLEELFKIVPDEYRTFYKDISNI